tara:strand:+ start:182 stop:1189 length:1008 start_codon:yes stop_codon:yes gene_type:complete
MDFNYTLKYKTFDQLMDEVHVDFQSYALEGVIQPQQLIKIAKRVTYDLGLRINMTKEVILEVNHSKAKLPDDFYVFNFGLICGEHKVHTGYDVGGTNIHEVPYAEVPATINQCAPATVNCSSCNCNPCNNNASCITNAATIQELGYDSNNPYGNTCVQPRVFFNCKGDAQELIQIVNSGQTRVYSTVHPLRMKTGQGIECECPNLYFNTPDEGWIKNNFLHTSFTTGKIYLNYQGALEDCDGNLMLPDHDEINQYYEYAIKQRILENLYLNGSDVVQRLQLVEVKLREARNRALSIVNTPNFSEMHKVWASNRKAMYSKYYDMFKSYSPNGSYRL